jgi:cation transport regulator ChaC
MARLSPASSEPARPSLTASPGRHWIFGYGSLAHIENLTGFLARHRLQLGAYSCGELAGFQRTWTVAMDNSQTLPRYKYYLDAATGVRPEVFVAFANIEMHHTQRVAGILFEVDQPALKIFDARERNYRRTDVTAHLSVTVEGTVWTYLGIPEASARFHHGLGNKALVIDKAYAQSIESAYTRAGLAYAPALPQHVPVIELTRVDT